jgi:peroxiredoxin
MAHKNKRNTPTPPSKQQPKRATKPAVGNRKRQKKTARPSVNVPETVAEAIVQPQTNSIRKRLHNDNNTINGALSTIPVYELFPFLNTSQQTGVLQLHFADSRLDSQFHFVSGQLTYARTPFAPGLLNMLQRRDVPMDTLKRIQRYLNTPESERHHLRDTADMNTADMNLLESIIGERLHMALLPLFYYDDGRFSFQRMQRGFQLTAKTFDTQMVCFQVSQKLEAIMPLGADTLAPTDRFHVIHDVGDFSHKTGDFTLAEWRVLASLFKPKMLMTLALELCMPWDTLVKALLFLERRGIIEQHHSERIPSDLPQLIPGQSAPMFALLTCDERPFSLGEMRGQDTVLIFFRYPGARICNAHIANLRQHTATLSASGVNLVAIFTGTPQHLREYVNQQLLEDTLPLTLLADPENTVHNLYKVPYSLAGLLDPRNVPAWLAGMRLENTGGDTYGQRTRMPATFFIGPTLRIESAFYGTFTNDHVSVQQIHKWLGVS